MPEEQPNLFGFAPLAPNPDDEWVGMPEYVHDDLSPYATFNIHFRSVDSIFEFLDLIGEKNWSGKSFWFPPEPIATYADKEYRAEREDEGAA